MTELDQVTGQIWDMFESELGLKPPDADIDLFTSGIMDSLTFVNMLMSLERRFGITVKLESLELENFHSISAIAQFVAAVTCLPAKPNGDRDVQGKRAAG
jgi:acyl carrier protein